MNYHMLENSLRDAVKDPARLAAVRATGLLDSEVEEVFDRLTRLAVRLLGVPAAFISLVDAERDFYKSACGFGEPLASARELAGPTFCHYTVQRTTPLVIPDISADPVYRDVPTVQTLGVAAYVGVPLIIDGQPIGAFCAIDSRPRAWTPEEVEVLVELAASAQREVELRGSVAAARAACAEVEAQRHELEIQNRQLMTQAEELEAQAEQLQATAAHLEEMTSDADTARSDAERAQAAAEAANRSKGEFLAMMSHELRTPLNAIGGYSDLIEMGVHGPVTPEQLTALERIKRSQRHLLGLINGVLDFAQVEAGAVSYELENVSVDEVLATCEALTAPQVGEKELELLDVCRDTKLFVHADHAKLQQIVVNLLSNAVKFTEPGGRVTLECGALGEERVSLRVSDTGRGIAADQLERVFQPFVQVDAKLTRAAVGTGLGLAISRDFARGMGGDLTVESAPGIGSTFILTLPSARAGPDSVHPSGA